MKVLIIEDDPTVVETVSLLFNIRWPGVELDSAGMGGEGIEKARAVPYDVVILDLGLPDIDGFDVLKQIRAFSQVPVVILTARVSEEVKERAMSLGANDYITKPFNRDLITRLKGQVEQQTPQLQAVQPVTSPAQSVP